jgi:hypothetical protein
MKPKILFLKCLIFLWSFYPIIHTYAQDYVPSSEQLWKIETKDGNEFIGKIIYEDRDTIKLETNNFGTLTIHKNQIKKRNLAKEELIKEGELWDENPQAARFFWAPNGYGLKRGEGYYQNVWIFFNQVSYGFTDNFSMGVGTVPIFLVGSSIAPFWITPKISIPLVENKFQLGVGALIGRVFDFNPQHLYDANSGTFGLLYGVATIGSKDSNINFGLGYGFASGELARYPTVTISGMHRVSKRGYIITENYIISTSESSVGLLSFGGRTILRKVSIDFGGIIPISNEMDRLYIIPWLGIVVPFNSRKAH